MNEDNLSLNDYTEIPDTFNDVQEYAQHIKHINEETRKKELNQKAAKGVIIALSLVVVFIGLVFIVNNTLSYIYHETADVYNNQKQEIKFKEVPIKINSTNTINVTNDVDGYLMQTKYLKKIEVKS